MGKMNVTYMSRNTGHGDMGDKHTFIRCSKCDMKYVKELNKTCPDCGGKGGAGKKEAAAIFKAAEDKIAAEVAEENAAEAKAKK